MKNNENTRGNLVYKCRRCGELDRPLFAPDIFYAVSDAMYGTQMTEGIRPTLLTVHQCADGHIGITDLIGGEYDNPTPRA